MSYTRMMIRYIPLVLLALGCGTAPSAQQAVDTAKSVLVAVDIGAELSAEAIVEARRTLVAFCRTKNLETPQEREACLGELAEPVGPIAADAAGAYDAVLEDLDRLAEALGKLNRMRGAAKAVRQEAPQ